MARLPIPGKDAGVWGDILNDYLSQSHTATGGLKDDTVGATQLKPDSVTSAAIATDAVTGAAVQDGTIAEAQLAPAVTSSLAAADSAVQSVNAKTGTSVTLSAVDVAAVPTTDKGTVNGVASLDNTAKIPISQLPSLLVRESESSPPTTGQLLRRRSDGTYEGVANATASGVAADTNGRVSIAATGVCPVGGVGSPPRSSGANAQASGITYRQPHVAVGPITDLRVVLAHWHQNSNNGPETVPSNDAYFKASIEYGSATYPLFFRGAKQVTLEGGATVTSDPLALVIPAGATYYVRVWANTPTTSGDVLCNAGSLNGNILSGLTGSYGNGDTAASTGALGTTSNTATLPGLVTLVGRQIDTRRPVILAVGDSITAGRDDAFFGGAVDTTGRRSAGWVQRGLGNSAALINVAVSGWSAQYWRDPAYRLRTGQFWSMATHALVPLGVNDFATAATLAQIQGYLREIWSELDGRGVKPYACTITPKTTSTDNWATTANQTPHANEAKRTAINDWIRGGAPLDASTLAPVALGTSGALLIDDDAHPLAGHLEIADTVETARNSGKWKVDGTAFLNTTDGTHPSGGGHQLMKVPVQSWLAGLTV